MMDRNLEEYLAQWREFEKHCERRAKAANCHINAKNWQKLKEFHLENYLQTIDNPFGFLFVVKIRYSNICRQINCMPRLYHKYLRLRQKELDSPSRNMIQFPTWRR